MCYSINKWARHSSSLLMERFYLQSVIEGKEIEILPQCWSATITTEPLGLWQQSIITLLGTSEVMKLLLCVLNEFRKLTVHRDLGPYTNEHITITISPSVMIKLTDNDIHLHVFKKRFAILTKKKTFRRETDNLSNVTNQHPTKQK